MWVNETPDVVVDRGNETETPWGFQVYYVGVAAGVDVVNGGSKMVGVEPNIGVVFYPPNPWEFQ